MKMRQKIVYSLVFMLIFSATVGAMASSNDFYQQKAEPAGERDYTHNILAEFGTATTCVPCKYAHQALKILFANKGEWNKPFFYVTLVRNKNQHALARTLELNLEQEPSVWWDGAFRLDAGAASLEHAISRYNISLPACGSRDVEDIDISLDIEWLSAVNPDPEDGATGVHYEPTLLWNLTAFNIDVAVENNEASTYNGNLRVYVTESNSSYWLDKFHLPYTMAFLDYAWNEDISISAGDTWEDSMEWDGCDYDTGLTGEDLIIFDDVWQDNIMVVATVFNEDNDDYSDETIGVRAGTNTYPKTYDVYFENTTPPTIKAASNLTSESFTVQELLEWNTTYYWKVVTWDNQDNPVESPIYDFTVRDNHAPNTPNNPFPQNNNSETPISANLSWLGGDPDNDTVYYDVYFGDTFPPMKVSANQTETYFNDTNLNFDTLYHWKIVAWDRFGFKTVGPNWTFRTEDNYAPNTPDNPIPPDGEEKAPVSINLSWEGGDPNLGDLVWYEIYLNENDPDPNYLTTIGPYPASKTDITYDLEEDLVLFETYNWKIIAKDKTGLTSPSVVWEFTTGENDPPVVSITGPQKVKENELAEFTFTITDEEEDNVWLYIDWGDGTNTTWMGPYSEYPIAINQEHSWTPRDTYTIQARVKDTFQPGEGDSFAVTVPIIKTYNLILLNFLQKIIHRFPVLDYLLSSITIFYKILEV